MGKSCSTAVEHTHRNREVVGLNPASFIFFRSCRSTSSYDEVKNYNTGHLAVLRVTKQAQKAQIGCKVMSRFEPTADGCKVIQRPPVPPASSPSFKQISTLFLELYFWIKRHHFQSIEVIISAK